VKLRLPIRKHQTRLLRVVGVVGAICTLAPALAHANTLHTITIPAKAGEIPSKWLSYYQGTPRANVLLPDGYTPHKRYPLLILLHGLNGNYESYAQAGDLTVFNGFPGIVVMPEGSDGWYADWWNDGTRGSPAWESYELNEVVPSILARYPILPQRRYHAIAGISMGGLGAPYLGGRLPGFFGSVATLSGFTDPQYFGAITEEAMGVTANAPQNGDDDPYPVEGPPAGFYATGHNPQQLTTNLKQTRVFESTGNGKPSSVELSQVTPQNATTYAGDWASEGQIIYPMNQAFHSALRAAGINVTYQVQNGGHDDPHFRQELQAMLTWGLFKPVVTDPTSWSNETVATSGQLWDVAYRFNRPPSQVVRFRRSRSSLSISAAGSAVTITASNGCVIRTRTPATVRIPAITCRRKRAAEDLHGS
jgi:S-formylglutathione hydrolase FrmB